MAFSGNHVCTAFKIAQLNGGINTSSDTYKMALYTSAASLDYSTAAYTADGETSGDGYTPGGIVITVAVQPVAVGSVVYMSFNNAVFNAALTARGALIYKDGGPAMFVLDFGSDKTSANFTVIMPAATADTALFRLE